MPITLTFHVFGLTITVTVKSNNRHPVLFRSGGRTVRHHCRWAKKQEQG